MSDLQARLKAQMRRNVLTPANAPKQDEPLSSDDSWLNDTHVSSTSTQTQTHEHVVHYEDLPTIALSKLPTPERPPAGKQQQVERADSQDVDATQRLSTSTKARQSVQGSASSAVPRPATRDFSMYGPLQELLLDDRISSITAFGPQHIYVELKERCGVNGKTRQVQETPCAFQNEQHMMYVVEALLRSAGRTLSSSLPLCDVRLPDGSLLSVTLPPSATRGPSFTLRKPTERRYSLDDLVREGMLDDTTAKALRKHVQVGRNICICGPSGSGKIQLLNALCDSIPDSERIVTIEEGVGERKLYALRQTQVISLLTHQESDTSRIEERERNSVTMQVALAHARHIHAQRIVVSRCHGDESPTLLRTIFDGAATVMMTMNAQDKHDCLSRLELHYLMHYLRGDVASRVPPALNTLLRPRISASLHVLITMSNRKVVDVVETTK
jgi:Flp pilus assembly CpaF family ATPase